MTQTQTQQDSGLAFLPAFSALVAGALAMGASPAFVRTAEIGPFASAFWRVALALPLLGLWAALERKKSGRKTQHIDEAFDVPILLAGLFFFGDLAFWHLAILNTTMANATLMACLAPVWVMVLSGVAIGEKVPPKSFLGLAICLAGAALLIGSSFTADASRIKGDIYGLITSVFFGLYFLAVRVARRRHRAGETIWRSSLITSGLLLATAIIAGNSFAPQSATGYASLLALGLVSHAGGQGLLAIALGALPALFSSLVIFLEAVFAAALGWIIFDEALDARQSLGGVLIFAGVWIARPRNL